MEQGVVVSISRSQPQKGFRGSWRLCLNYALKDDLDQVLTLLIISNFNISIYLSVQNQLVWSSRVTENSKMTLSSYSVEFTTWKIPLTLSWRGPLLYRNQSIDLQSKSMDWFLYDNGLRHESVKKSFRQNSFEKLVVLIVLEP